MGGFEERRDYAIGGIWDIGDIGVNGSSEEFMLVDRKECRQQKPYVGSFVKENVIAEVDFEGLKAWIEFKLILMQVQFIENFAIWVVKIEKKW